METIGNNGQQWEIMGNNGEQSAELHASVTPFLSHYKLITDFLSEIHESPKKLMYNFRFYTGLAPYCDDGVSMLSGIGI